MNSNQISTPHGVSFDSSPSQVQQQFVSVPSNGGGGMNNSFQQQPMQQVVYVQSAPNGHGQQYTTFPQNGTVFMMPQNGGGPQQQQFMFQQQQQQQLTQQSTFAAATDGAHANNVQQQLVVPQQLNTSTISAALSKAHPSRSDEVTLAESLFLFCWAFISNVKEFILESSVDLYEHLFAAETNRKLEMLRRHKKRKAFFKRIKMEMGIQTKKTKKSLSTGAFSSSQAAATELNLSAISNASANEEEEEDHTPGGASKLEALEQELMFLKQQLTMVAPKRKSTSRRSTSSRRTSSVSVIKTDSKRKSKSNKRKSTKRKSNRVSLIMNKENDSSVAPQQEAPRMPTTSNINAPPAPPLPMARFKAGAPSVGAPPPPPISGLHAKLEAAAGQEAPKGSTSTVNDSRPPVLKTMSFNELIRQQQGQLRKTSHLQKKTTHKKAKEPQFCFQHELFAAIQNKFKSMHAANGVRQATEAHTESDSDSSDSEGDWSSPKRKNMTPIRH